MSVSLLVTLEKAGLNKDHRYEDHFLSVDRFQWQSQNKAKQESQHGQLIHNHHTAGVDVHLFVRKCKVLDGRGDVLTSHQPAARVRSRQFFAPSSCARWGSKFQSSVYRGGPRVALISSPKSRGPGRSRSVAKLV
ncbi:MAG: DUF3427 domain-containing protein [Pirellulaceae bacterium]